MKPTRQVEKHVALLLSLDRAKCLIARRPHPSRSQLLHTITAAFGSPRERVFKKSQESEWFDGGASAGG